MNRNIGLIRIYLIIMLFSAIVININGAESTTYTNIDGIATLSNTLIELKWETTHGTLVGLKNKITGTQYIDGNYTDNWVAFINKTTGNKWLASLGTIYKGRNIVLNNILSSNFSNGITLEFLYKNIEGMNITIKQHVTLSDNDPVSKWNTEIINNELNTVVTAIISPKITGIKVLTNESLMWPWKEGQIFKNPGDILHIMQYPVPASMQWMNLFNEDESLYYSVLDSTASYKEFRFGYDSALDYSTFKPRQMSVTFWPFVQSSETFISATVEIGVANEGEWYWGADRYRSWLINNGWEKSKFQIVNELAGWRTGFNKLYTESFLRNTYSEIPNLISGINEYGIHLLEMLGWHYNGFDSYYPDYDYLTGAGGGDGLQNAIAEIHNNGDKVFFYINNHIADIESNWYNSNSGIANIKKIDGSYYMEKYGTAPNRTFSAMCPKSDIWIRQLNNRVMDLRMKGADGIWWDQMMEMDAVLCYNSNHGHSSPATAFSEGYADMMNTIHKNFSYNGTQTNYIFAAEGVNDYYSKFVDICGMMWARSFGYDTNQAPQVTRYTIPAKFLGLPNSGKSFQDKDQYALAFLMGDPLLIDISDNKITNSYVFPRYPNIYNMEPQIYYYGTYKDKKGLFLDNTNIQGTTIIGQNKDRIGVQLYNPTLDIQKVTVNLDFSKLGIEKKAVTKISNIENGTAIKYLIDGNSVKFDIIVPSGDVVAIKVSLGNASNFLTNNKFDNIKIYPNPFYNNVFTIESNDRGFKNISIFNILGERIYYKEFPMPLKKYECFVNNITNGVYFLQITKDNKEIKKLKLIYNG